ncbi:13967_t:CDS:1 [Ambispora leptoticha]|uniref:13967_t:CDS:1 n=1 Tax=Ambispora leptoticha TaxID=144679 RepID=A0A9N9FET8_9GLOM|nr:13967_t:CDS:1 [Ambispora leptoticha]
MSYSSYNESRTHGPLNELAKMFLQTIDRGTNLAKIKNEIREHVKTRNNLEPPQMLENLKRPRYQRQFRCLLGYCYETGALGSKVNLRKAVHEYKTAADNEYTYGQFLLGKW